MGKNLQTGVMQYQDITLVNGCFDLFHAGHFSLLQYAAEFALPVIVGIDSDKKIKTDKGPNRPYFTQEERKKQLLSLWFVKEVFTFDTNVELEQKIKEYSPFYLVKGNNWKDHIVGAPYAKHIILHKEKLPISTTEIVEKVAKKILK
jgi:D-beta-D-heptose 7-phosphate kinase/D-beta-D-heptose 1-phosphate adenosyltransferase